MHNLSTLTEQARKAAMSAFSEMYGEEVPADLRQSLVDEMMSCPETAGKMANAAVVLSCFAMAGVSVEKLLSGLFKGIVEKPHDNPVIATMGIIDAHLRAANPEVAA